MRVVLDADVLIGALDASDHHHAAARRLLRRWDRDGSTLLTSVVNLTEVLIAPAGDPATLAVAREAIGALGIGAQRPSEAIAVAAARLRSRHPISLADAYCLATGRALSAAIASFDQRLKLAARAEKLAIASNR